MRTTIGARLTKQGEPIGATDSKRRLKWNANYTTKSGRDRDLFTPFLLYERVLFYI